MTGTLIPVVYEQALFDNSPSTQCCFPGTLQTSSFRSSPSADFADSSSSRCRSRAWSVTNRLLKSTRRVVRVVLMAALCTMLAIGAVTLARDFRYTEVSHAVPLPALALWTPTPGVKAQSGNDVEVHV